MFDPRITPGWIEDDINSLASIRLWEQWVNELVSSLVIKYIQQYFWASDVWEWLNMLEERLEQWWGWWNLINTPVNESYTLECLWSVSQTSAIMKEIIFHDWYETDGEFRSCDLGSGTGILSLGAYVSWLRKGLKKWKIHLMDHEKVSLEKSIEVLKAIVWPSFEVHGILGNITKSQELKQIGEDKIQFWISETIGMGTPRFSINPTTGKPRMKKEDLEFYKSIRAIDPFPEVVANIVTRNPDLESDIKSWKVALFPDHITGLYKPNLNRSTLDLKTSWKGPQRLWDIGQEFDYIIPFDAHRRWTNM